ncbi:MAG TPA: L,D-transpeptidase family protein [Thermoanaerobaculia bacterium]|jgi:murein L,D-transpeptidase YcbB/YkuD|nr:L,D-transpeptidase family protein [Thermoanaerobaculia bacterium]
MRRSIVCLLLLFVCPAVFGQAPEPLPQTAGAKLIQSLVEAGRMDELRWPDFSDYRKHLRNFYGPVGYTNFWSSNGRVTPQARVVISMFEAADVKGINAVDYDAPRWRERLALLDAAPNETALARFDLALSATLMRYISDLHIGRINPRNLRFDLDIEGKKYYLPTRLTDVAVSPDPAMALSDIEPQYEEYRRLQQALGQYRRYAADAANEKPLPVVKSVKPGDAYAGLAQLTRMLRRIGDLPTPVAFDETRGIYDGALIDAVKRFQTRHGLENNGTMGPKTFAALNVPLGYRVRQIQWALERWRWAPMQFSAPPIIVNVPEFVLRAWGPDNKTAVTMRVVVGQAYNHQTPIFEDETKYVVFRPYWNVTPNIQRGEIVPHLEKGDRDYLARNNYEIVDANDRVIGATVDDARIAHLRTGDYRVRQKPGSSNALGLVKFMFPNENNVYLHSTPAQTLFDRSRRDFSHGCIRVADPAGLAAWVLRDQPEWTPQRIKGAMNGTGDPTVVRIRQPIPIMIIYTTAHVQDDGAVQFFEDIYKHDATLEEALAAGYPYPA